MKRLMALCFLLAAAQTYADVEQVYVRKLEDFRKQVVVDTVAKVLNYSDGLPDEGSDHAFWYAYNAKECIYRKADYSASLSSDIKSITLDVVENRREIRLNSYDRSSIKYQSYELKYPIDGRVTTSVVILADGREIFSAEGIQSDRVAKGWSLIYGKYCTGAKKEF